jgi:hypothetical protein
LDAQAPIRSTDFTLIPISIGGPLTKANQLNVFGNSAAVSMKSCRAVENSGAIPYRIDE